MAPPITSHRYLCDLTSLTIVLFSEDASGSGMGDDKPELPARFSPQEDFSWSVDKTKNIITFNVDARISLMVRYHASFAVIIFVGGSKNIQEVEILSRQKHRTRRSFPILFFFIRLTNTKTSTAAYNIR